MNEATPEELLHTAKFGSPGVREKAKAEIVRRIKAGDQDCCNFILADMVEALFQWGY